MSIGKAIKHIQVEKIDIHSAITLLQFIIFSSKLNQTCALVQNTTYLGILAWAILIINVP